MPLPYFAADTIRLYAAIQTYNRDDYPAEGFTAEMYESTPEIKREVRAWQRERNIAHGRA
jgi:hypothetical protein